MKLIVKGDPLCDMYAINYPILFFSERESSSLVETIKRKKSELFYTHKI